MTATIWLSAPRTLLAGLLQEGDPSLQAVVKLDLPSYANYAWPQIRLGSFPAWLAAAPSPGTRGSGWLAAVGSH